MFFHSPVPAEGHSSQNGKQHVDESCQSSRSWSFDHKQQYCSLEQCEVVSMCIGADGLTFTSWKTCPFFPPPPLSLFTMCLAYCSDAYLADTWISPICIGASSMRTSFFPPLLWFPHYVWLRTERDHLCRGRWNAGAIRTGGGGFARLFQLHLLFSAAKENILFTDSCYCDNTSSVVCTAMCDVADHGKAASYCHNS